MPDARDEPDKTGGSPKPGSPARSPSTRRLQGHARVASAGHSDSLEKKNFYLEEQVRDLKYQVSSKAGELAKLQENSNTRYADYESKLKKMRGIFAQATKNIDGYRATIAEKDIQIQSIQDELGQVQQREEKIKQESQSQARDLERLASELNSLKVSQLSRSSNLEAKVQQLSSQLEKAKAEHAQYKKRAGQLLEKTAAQGDAADKLSAITSELKKVQREKSDMEDLIRGKEQKQLLLEQDLHQALARLHDLEMEHARLVNTAKENGTLRLQVERGRQELEETRRLHKKAMDDMRQVHEDTIRQLEGAIRTTVGTETLSAPDGSPESRRSSIPAVGDSPDIDKKEGGAAEAAWKQERDDLEAILEKMEQENADLRTRLRELEQQPIPVASKTPEEPAHVDVYASMNNLLSPLAQGGQARSHLEREVKQLRYMLEESEEQVAALRTQEKILKEEIRKLDSFDRRQNLNNEYLKNVMLKFMETENKEVMVPILAKLLHLDASETEMLKKASART